MPPSCRRARLRGSAPTRPWGRPRAGGGRGIPNPPRNRGWSWPDRGRRCPPRCRSSRGDPAGSPKSFDHPACCARRSLRMSVGLTATVVATSWAKARAGSRRHLTAPRGRTAGTCYGGGELLALPGIAERALGGTGSLRSEPADRRHRGEDQGTGLKVRQLRAGRLILCHYPTFRSRHLADVRVGPATAGVEPRQSERGSSRLLQSRRSAARVDGGSAPIHAPFRGRSAQLRSRRSPRTPERLR